jgi:hypothetical protein
MQQQRMLSYNLANKITPEQLNTIFAAHGEQKDCHGTAQYVFSNGYWQFIADFECVGS